MMSSVDVLDPIKTPYFPTKIRVFSEQDSRIFPIKTSRIMEERSFLESRQEAYELTIPALDLSTPSRTAGGDS